MTRLFNKYTTEIISLNLFIFTFIIYLFSGEGHPTVYNNFVRLADAFIHGRLHLDQNISWLELANYNGRYYVIPPPMPAILIMPYVFFKGLLANQVYASVFFGSLNVSLAYLIAREFSKRKSFQILSAILFGFSTIHWWMASTGWVWFFSQVTSVTFLFLSILIILKTNRIFLAGILIGASFLCRLPTILAAPFFIIMFTDKWYLNKEDNRLTNRIRISPILYFLLGVSVFVAINSLYNYLRFESILDKSYYLVPGLFEEPWYQRGLFNLSYIPRHLELIFLKMPNFLDKKPYLMPSWYGMSIFITTPAVVYAFLNKPDNKLVIGCLTTIILISLVDFSHGGTGWVQFGYRYAVDYYPFLYLLILNGSKKRYQWHYFTLLVFGIIVNLWGVLWINKFGWVSF